MCPNVSVRPREQQRDQSESRKGPELSKGKRMAVGKAECTMPDENTVQTTQPRNKVLTAKFRFSQQMNMLVLNSLF